MGHRSPCHCLRPTRTIIGHTSWRTVRSLHRSPPLLAVCQGGFGGRPGPLLASRTSMNAHHAPLGNFSGGHHILLNPGNLPVDFFSARPCLRHAILRTTPEDRRRAIQPVPGFTKDPRKSRKLDGMRCEAPRISGLRRRSSPVARARTRRACHSTSRPPISGPFIASDARRAISNWSIRPANLLNPEVPGFPPGPLATRTGREDG